VSITDVSKADAVRVLAELVCASDGRCRAVFIANAHTLNLATDEPDYAKVLNSADYVFSDGTGVRWAARQRGIKLRDNLCGTDLVPELFRATAGQGYRFFLLGADPGAIQDAAAFARQEFCGWTLVGHHHGYLHQGQSEQVVNQINTSNAHMLLVGMGNPIQERWIHAHRARLRVPLAVGVGGLFSYWAGGLKRAPWWVRKAGCEWIHILLKQPRKWERYLLGNPKFLYRMTRALKEDVATMKERATVAGGVTAKNNRPLVPESHVPSTQRISVDVNRVSRIDSAHDGPPTPDKLRQGVEQRTIEE
jgi:N-acetylglucosaminyldiphosphoundecaprenol N-acetyl-beta-D-mannosaminyltransferase